MEYNFESDIKFLTGDKALRKSINEINNIGCRRIMLICDDITERVGQLSDMLHQFNKELNIVSSYKRVGEIATVNDCEKVLREYKSEDCDSILVVGRKSAVAVAKAVKIMLKDDISFMSNYRTCSVNNISSIRIPLIVVPTNLASGTEASNFVRVYDTDNNQIFEFNTPFAQTNLIVLDPIMTDTMPPRVFAASGLYSLAMAVLSLSKTKDVRPLAKVYAVTAINLLTENLKKAILQNAARQYRFKLLLATVLAGYAYWQTPKDILSELADTISDRYRISYRNIFCILFLRYVNKHHWPKDFDMNALITLIGDNDYLAVSENTQKDNQNSKTQSPDNSETNCEKEEDKNDENKNVIRDSVNGYYARTKKYVNYIDRLRDLGVKQSDFTDIASSVISMHKEDKEEYTYSFITELLEESF